MIEFVVLENPHRLVDLVVPSVGQLLQHGLDSGPSLLAGRNDVGGGKNETVATVVSEFHGV